MQFTQLARRMGPNDAKLVSRDQMMLGLMIYPIINTLLLRYGLTPLRDWLMAKYSFDLQPYAVLITSYLLVIMIPLFVGMVVGTLLLEEREDNTLSAMLVTPLSLGQLVGYRVWAAAVVSFLMIVVLVPLANVTQITMGLGQLLGLAALSAFNAPVTALLFFSFATDKVQAFAVLKVISLLNTITAVAFFIAPPWQYLFGLVPAFWAAKGFWVANMGEITAVNDCFANPTAVCLIDSYPLGSAQMWLCLTAGLIFNLIILAILVRRFQTQHYA